MRVQYSQNPFRLNKIALIIRELIMEFDTFMDALKEEFDELTKDELTFLLKPDKAKLIQNICEKLRTILNESNTEYSLSCEKGAILSPHVHITITTKYIDAAFGKMDLFKECINKVDEITVESKGENVIFTLYIRDAYMQIIPVQ